MPHYRFSYLMTYRESDPSRRQNLDFLLHLLRLDPTLEVILVEQDSFAHFRVDDTHNVRYLFVENSGPFNKSWGLNIAAARASCDRLILADTDILLSAAAVDALAHNMDKGADAINPYSDLIDLTETESQQLLARAGAVHLERTQAQLNRQTQGQNPPFCGGAFAITRTLFRQCGGMDERFVGWGAEDDAMSKRVAHFAQNMLTLDYTAYHLWHQPSSASSDYASNYIRNLALLTLYYERGAGFCESASRADANRNANIQKHQVRAPSRAATKRNALVSCLCITKGRATLLTRAIHCFRAQSYAHKELIVVTESDDHETHALLARFDSNLIKHHIVPCSPKLSLGELRNVSIDIAQGDYICQWDDDDWYHPDRIARQLESIQKHNKAASVLPRWLIHETQTDKVYCSNIRLWEGSILCDKSALPATKIYDARSRGEDSELIEKLYLKDELAIVDMPDLYVYCVRGENTWDPAHFKRILDASNELNPEESATVKMRIAR